MGTGPKSQELWQSLGLELKALLEEREAMREEIASSRADICALQRRLSQPACQDGRQGAKDQDLRVRPSPPNGGDMSVGTSSELGLEPPNPMADRIQNNFRINPALCEKPLAEGDLEEHLSQALKVDFSEDLEEHVGRYPEGFESGGRLRPLPVTGSQHRASLDLFEKATFGSTQFDSAMTVFGSLKPSSSPVLKRIGEVLVSWEFEVTIGMLIVINTIIMAFEMQYHGLEAGYQADFEHYNRPASQRWPGAESVFLVFERAFTFVFTIELAVRILVLRCVFFKAPLNWIDVISVVAGLLDWAFSEKGFVNPMMARLLRLTKLARGLRIAKMSRVLDSLHLLLKCIAASVSTLAWSVLLLLMLQCITGMIISQLVRDIILDPNKDIMERQRVFSYYGTFTRSQITMFEVHLANFAPACRVLVDYCGEWYAVVFLAYRCLAGYAVLNVINAVFIQQTMETAQKDREIAIAQKEKAAKLYSKELKTLFARLATSGDGSLSLTDLEGINSVPELKLWMGALDIDTRDPKGLFKLMDIDGDEKVTFDEFLEAATRLKGPAKGIDMLSVLARLKKLTTMLDHMLDANGRFNFSRNTTPGFSTHGQVWAW